ncbi:B12-binding domain-containing radical SAM protein [Methanothermobacter tenebrarum]|uniref:B12-binding domain-containing radical SAM protein n=1 Tax=Methanothermobacter tenebrarum TaxID=680118 RepID=A0A328PAY2_9EURY|nr:radical SAM protein [Methanothermobacter tenebrarum]MBC7318340.1 radical SAM protein [Candidatus Bipolaricaulota bacterium]NPV64435.1 radical SAM protein [Methanobacteriaceae archaeon]RAO78790.1 B12-binding domain-containing radical SAM protein [Methanothermobacter tenebrarum]HHV75484.1 radical SAM protein [Thermoanaerobacterium sp.]
MKIYFLNPPYMPHFGRGMRWQDTGRGGTLYYPIWLSYAAALLDKYHKIKLVDAPAWNWDKKDVLRDIEKFQPELIVMDSSFPSLQNDIKIAEYIKQNYDARIILVGPPGSQFSDKILQSPGVDIVTRYEYDFTLHELAEKLESQDDISHVKGISYKKDGRIIHNPDRELSTSEDLDRIPFVSKIYKKFLNIKDYFLGSSLYPEVQIFTGRGCPFQCTFCSWPHTLMGRKYRVRSIENVLDELEWIEKNLPEVKEVFFEDDTFTINKKRVLRFCKEYEERDLKITWACNARVGLDYETMREMKKANCRLLIVGFESGNNSILENVKKGITVDDIKKFSEDAKKAGLLVHGDFIIGLPGETRETIKNTKKLIWEIKPDILQVSVASPFPGTEFYEWCYKNGYLVTSDPNEYLDENGHQKSIIRYPKLTEDEITEEVNKILKDYYISPSYFRIAIHQILRKNGIHELQRLIYSARMFLKYLGGSA